MRTNSYVEKKIYNLKGLFFAIFRFNILQVEGEQVFLILEDHNLRVDPDFLDMINSLLSSGEVPGLYSPEELEPLLATLRERASGEGVSNLFTYSANSVRKNLHVILIMDSRSDTFLRDCESNPAIYKQCRCVSIPVHW